MEMRQLKYFVVLAEELHFHRAAARLSISQPPLSSAIKHMEAELDTLLFERNTKTVALTAAGRALYPQAVRTLAQFDLACTVARRTGSGVLGQLRVGYTGGMLLRGAPQMVREFESVLPGVEVSLCEMASAAQADAIAHRQLSGGFLHAMVVPPELDFITLQREPFVCCLHASHPLASRRRISLRQLAGEPWIIFPRHISPSYFDAVIALTTAAGFSPQIRHEVTHWVSAVMLVAQKSGVAVVPQAFAMSRLGDVRYLAIQETASQSLAHFVWRKDDDDPVLQRFTRHVRDWKPAIRVRSATTGRSSAG
ncbi:HTH-type transcriptional regulator BenM [Pigmentiphaga humi]|uniref:HTH-type transcriptional regulator BenM n=1 Tax=Pigmentiphaga humi TaxID=2478468 RepID=A0A3P4B1A2_9BURK|nr:LysR family transcriptional regulator [Pigmentiphaga humi]VCU70073.1 HTH-type transcriptional regulator BenM [Pigmentiphaga humi]